MNLASTSKAGQQTSIIQDFLNHPRHPRHARAAAIDSLRVGGPSLMVLYDSLVQSNTPLIAETVARSLERSEPVLLVCLFKEPEIYTSWLPNQLRERASDGLLTTLHASLIFNAFANQPVQPPDIAAIVAAKATELVNRNPAARLTVLIDSFESVFADFAHGADVAYACACQVLASLREGSRLIIGMCCDDCSPESKTFDERLYSARLWVSETPGSVTSICINAPGYQDYVKNEYGLVLPPTPAAIRKQIESKTGERCEEQQPDPGIAVDEDARIWNILNSVSKRGTFGSAAARGWWASLPHSERPPFEALTQSTSRPGCILGRSRDRAGRFRQEVLLCVFREGRLRLAPISLQDSHIGPRPAPAGPSHDGLSFNLGETSIQRERRDQVPLPHMTASRKGQIIFEPESDDDPDESDPDDDIDF